MKNLLQASKDIKKKLSLDDYSLQPLLEPSALKSELDLLEKTSEELREVEMPLDIKADIGQISIKTHDNSLQHISNQATCVSSPPEQSICSSHGFRAEQSSSVLHRCAHSCEISENIKIQPKIKVTHYLTAEDHKALMRIYIKRLQNDLKVDKSALITEALHLLCQKEQI